MRNTTSIDWTEDRINRLKALWAEGTSSGTIAAEMGITRNAVIGKINRLKLPKRGNQGQHNTTVQRTNARNQREHGNKGAPKAAAIVRKAEVRQAVSEDPRSFGDMPDGRRLYRLEELVAHSCRWPFGNPGEPNFGFCGHQVAPSRPYCHDHCRKSYQGWQG